MAIHSLYVWMYIYCYCSNLYTQGQEPPSALDLVRCIATARVVMPRSVIRLSAGRISFNVTDQALCFLAGANSIFDGDKLLTTPNNDRYVAVRCVWTCTTYLLQQRRPGNV